MILWFSVAAKKASQSVNLFSLSIPAMCLPGVRMNFRQSLLFVSRVVCCVSVVLFPWGLRYF